MGRDLSKETTPSLVGPQGPEIQAPKAPPEGKNVNISAKTELIRRRPGSFEPPHRTEQNHMCIVIFGGVFAEILAENRRARFQMAPAGDVIISGANRSLSIKENK